MVDTRVLRNDALLLTTAAVWGLAFTAQRAGMDFVGPFTYNGVRFVLGTVSLVPLLFLLPAEPTQRPMTPHGRLTFLRDGVLAGLLLFGGSSFQQVGLLHTTAGKAGFITGLYVVIVPIWGALLGRRTDRGRWNGAFLAVVGLYFLSVGLSFFVNPGDVFVLVCAFFFAAHVLLLSRLSRMWNALKLAALQYLTTGVLSLAIAFTTETPDIQTVVAAWLPIVYGGVCSVGIAYSLQIIAQRHAHPAHAAILLSLEGAFAALGGFLILGEVLSPRDLIGCALMLAGMLASQSAAVLRTARVRTPSGARART